MTLTNKERKVGGRRGGLISSSILYTCTTCGRTIKGAVFFRHLKQTHKKIETNETSDENKLVVDRWNDLIDSSIRVALLNPDKITESMCQTENFTDAKWYLYELIDETGKVVYVGITGNPNTRLAMHTKKRPHATRPTAAYGLFYGQNLILDVIAGFDTKSDALRSEKALKEENGFKPTEYNQFHDCYIAKGTKACVASVNHNVKQKWLCENGRIVNALHLTRYCKNHGLDKEKAVRLD